LDDIPERPIEILIIFKGSSVSSSPPSSLQPDTSVCPDLEELVLRIRNGCDSSVGVLYSQLLPPMKMYMRRRIGVDFEDAVQDSFLALLKAIQSGSLDQPAALRAYLCTIMFRRCRLEYSKPRLIELESASVQIGSLKTVNQVFAEFEMASKRQYMTDALERLPVQMRIIIEKCFLEEKPKEIIMGELCLTETQFRLLKSRAKLRLAMEVRKIQSLQCLMKSVNSERNSRRKPSDDQIGRKQEPESASLGDLRGPSPGFLVAVA
jgi:RNA polymerase sigma-70 factor (ECF subfamily)